MNAPIVFVDESGVMLAPFVRRSWAPRGQTPILRQRGAHRQKVSVIAAISIRIDRRQASLYFRTYPEVSIDRTRIPPFLGQLRRHIRGPFILVWDGLAAHRSPNVRRYCAQRGIDLERLPPYAPELNPVEMVWSFLKMNPLANLAPHNLEELIAATRQAGRSTQRKLSVIEGCLHHTPLFFWPR